VTPTAPSKPTFSVNGSMKLTVAELSVAMSCFPSVVRPQPSLKGPLSSATCGREGGPCVCSCATSLSALCWVLGASGHQVGVCVHHVCVYVCVCVGVALRTGREWASKPIHPTSAAFTLSPTLVKLMPTPACSYG